MKIGIFVNEDSAPYAALIVNGQKTIETRTRNMLKRFLGRRVEIISTHKNKAPMVIGHATIEDYAFCNAQYLDMWRNDTQIPKGDVYDNLGTRKGISGKWFYFLKDAAPCEPYPLPKNAIRHGRTWAEF